jgi:dihydropteroate synthase
MNNPRPRNNELPSLDCAPTAPVRGVRPRVIECRGLELTQGRFPRVMGILNVTPDSFSDGNDFARPEAAIRHALAMRDAGAHIIDVGGESTRPGATPVSAGEELDRVLPVLDAICHTGDRGERQIPVSIDTRKAEVADAAIRHGCHMVNDVSAASDPEMTSVLRDHPGVPIVLMHMYGEPGTMQDAPRYDDVVSEVSAYLAGRAEAMIEAGIERGRIIIDPGIGFGKRFADNLELLNRIDSLGALGYPVLIGASRKWFLGELLDAPAGDRLAGSLAVAAHCYRSGIDIVRVHDVAATAGMFRVLDALDHPGDYKAR